jgi:2-desacetyl-2-hydroxyethyl bacteriochlorophyllide A dehydrogenase
MRAAEWLAPEELQLIDMPEPAPADGQAVVEVAACGICGSDLHSYSQGFAAKPGQVLGHEFSGVVTAAPGVHGIAEGDRVTVRPLIPCGECAACRAGEIQLCAAAENRNIGYGSPGAFAERVLVPRAIAGQTIFRLPEDVSDRAGALFEPLAVGLRSVHLSKAGPGDVALVLGAGTIGLAVTRFLKLAGVGTLIVAEPSELRRDRARALGADIVIDPLAEKTSAVVRGITGPGVFGLGARADVVVDCAGNPSAFAEGLKSVRHGGTLVITAMYTRKIEINPDRMTEKELVVRGSMAYRDEFTEVIERLADGSVDPELFISHTFELEEVKAAFLAQLDREASLKVLVGPKAG